MNCGREDKDIRGLKKQLLERLCAPYYCTFSDAAEVKLRGVLSSTFDNSSSSAVLITGPSMERNFNFVNKVLNSFQTARESSGKQQCRVAMIRGRTFGDDRQALLHLARELGFTTSGQNFGLNVEVVQEIMKSGKLSSSPTVLILESFEEFARSSRQILLYTLLDLMHRKDLLFTVVGLTCCADVTSQLEKRILSRLNAQFIELAPPTPTEICEELSWRLHYIEPHKCASAPGTPENLTRTEDDFISAYNNKILEVFGHPSTDGESDDSHSVRKKRRASESLNAAPPLALSAIDKYAKWGVPCSSFILAAKKCVIYLENPPLISTAMFYDCLNELFPDKLFEVVSSLPKYELWMLCVCYRLHCRSKLGLEGRSNTGQPKKRSDIGQRCGTGVSSHSVVSFSAGAAIADFEKLTKFGSKDAMLKRDLYSMLLSLENLQLLVLHTGVMSGSKTLVPTGITNETAVVLGIPPLEAKALFRRSDLKLMEKARRAVNEPLEPLAGDIFHGEQSLGMME